MIRTARPPTCAAGWPTSESRQRHVAASQRTSRCRQPPRCAGACLRAALRAAVCLAEFAEAIDVLLATCGERILRVKGLIGVEGEPDRGSCNASSTCATRSRRCPAWPDDDHQSRLVFIVRALARDIVEQAFVMFCGAAALSASR
jgi:G3E family GTPase